ncbi:MAG: hypothetical protein V9G98_27890 [Candidatus Competibacter sp.]
MIDNIVNLLMFFWTLHEKSRMFIFLIYHLPNKTAAPPGATVVKVTGGGAAVLF